MKLHYFKQPWLKGYRRRQIFSLFIPISGGIGIIILGHELAIIKKTQHD